MIHRPHKGWHSRGYLPHLDARDEIQSITFRLEDALPQHVINSWIEEFKLSNVTNDPKENHFLRTRIAKYEDAGHGSCVLGDPQCAIILKGALHFFDSERYRLLEWCILPNHVHVLVHLPFSNRLSDIIQSWKTFSSRRINKKLGRKGQLWAEDYHDRYIRNEEHLHNARSYIRNNPVKAGLCEKPEDWAWSSAAHSP